MKKLILSAALLLGSLLGVNAQGLQGVTVEKFYVTNATDATAGGATLPAGTAVYRFYLDLNQDWFVQSVYGDPNHTLQMSTTTTFYNQTSAGNQTGNAVNSAFFGVSGAFSLSYIDTYVTLGATCGDRAGLPKPDDNTTNNFTFAGGVLAHNDATAGIPLTTRDGSSSGTVTPPALSVVGLINQTFLHNGAQTSNSSITSDPVFGGGWNTSDAFTGAADPVANKVLIAQLTTNGVITYSFNVQIKNSVTLAVETWVYSNPTGTEQVLPALAGTANSSNALPTASITSPTTGATYLVGAPVVINANATDPDGSITLVEFLVDGNVVGTGSGVGPAYTLTPGWPATVGSHNLTVRATDDLGGVFTSSPAVVILVGAVIPPTVNITSPASGATFVLGDTPTISATATDDGTVTQVEFFVDGNSIGIDNSGPAYDIIWPVLLGNHNLTAVATDNDNATTTSAAIPVTVFDSSSAYVLISSNNPCTINTFCQPINAIVAVDNVIGYDIVLAYDNTEVFPTGVITVNNDLINPAYVSTANSINSAAGLMYISVFFNGSAPLGTEFNGTGELLCVEFGRTAGFGATDTTDFVVNSLQESYINGVEPKVVSPGSYSTFQETDFNSRLQFWFDGSPIRYDGTATYLITNIYGTNAVCGAQSVAAVQPDINGEFSYDYNNGPYININKEIPNAISVQPVVNGFDAFLTRRVLINDASFLPSVYQIIAMDVNTDGVVSSGDLSQINQRAVLVLGEFQQDWNYTPGGVSLGPLSKDWLFIDQTTLTSNTAYLISTTYPFDDGIGFSKSNVPQLDFCLEVPYQVSATCNTFDLESYTGILLGDANGNFATNTTGGPFRLASTGKVVFDLSNAVTGKGYVEVPVIAVSEVDVNALDFSMNFNEGKAQFGGIVKHAEAVETLANFNNSDRELRFTSYSLEKYDLSIAPVSVRFNTIGELSTSDLSNVVAYLNGEQVAAEVIGSRIGGEAAMVSVFPNPAKDVVNVITSENVKIEMMDANGRVVLALDNMNAYQKYEFNTQELARGIYLLKVYGTDFVSVKKVVIE